MHSSVSLFISLFLDKRALLRFCSSGYLPTIDQGSPHVVFTIKYEMSLLSYVMDLYIGEQICNRHSKTRKKMVAGKASENVWLAEVKLRYSRAMWYQLIY